MILQAFSRTGALPDLYYMVRIRIVGGYLLSRKLHAPPHAMVSQFRRVVYVPREVLAAARRNSRIVSAP